MLKLNTAACLLTLAAFVQAAEPGAATRYDAARDAYETGHYGSAFTAFAALADEGHCDAARIALQMLRYGRTLYATEFEAARERVAHWRRQGPCAAPAPQVARTR